MLWLRLIPAGIALTVLVACAKAVQSKQAHSVPLSSLAGSEWGFQGDDNGPFVQFGSKSDISGFGGCNRFFGTYELNGQKLTVGPLASTKKACVGPAMETERKFLQALQNARRIDATHLALQIYDDSGVELLSLIRRDWD